MASSSAEQPPVEMDAKLMMATGISNCQRLLEDLLNKGDAKTVVVMVSSNQLPNAEKPPPGPATMDPQLLSLACSGSCQELSLLLNRNAAPGRSDVMPTRSSLELGTNASSVTHQVSNEVEEGFSPALLLEGITVEGNTALHAVATNGDSDDFLMSANVIYDKANHLMFAQNKNGDTPLHCAARAGKSKMVRRLIALARTEDEGGERLKELLRKENMRKETALHEAVRINDQHTVELLMVEDSELACFPRDGCSPLYQAILLDDDNIAHYLLAKSDGNLSYSGPNGQNALHAAVLRGTSALTKKLLEWKEDLAAQRDENGSTPLHFAAALQNQHWCRSVCQQVLEANLDALYQSDHDGLFPIHIAASVGNKWAVALFLQKSPGCGGLRDAKERTFLHVAVEKYKVSTVSFACRNRSLTWILNVQDNDGNTALHLAVHSGRLRVFCPLLGNRQVHLNLTNKKGQTPLDISQCKKPSGLNYNLNSKRRIHRALELGGARNGGCRQDHFQEKYTDQANRDDTEESQKVQDSTQTFCIASVLIATVAFGATFALPGGYRADDHPNGGTPTLAGRYAFDAFMMASTLAFVCSAIAIIGFMHSGSPLIDLPIRKIYFGVAVYFMSTSVTSLTATFTLGVYMMLATVAHKTAVAICVISPIVVLCKNIEFWLKWAFLAPFLCLRRGIVWTLAKFAGLIIGKMLFEFWPLLLIFGWAAFARHYNVSK